MRTIIQDIRNPSPSYRDLDVILLKYNCFEARV